MSADQHLYRHGRQLACLDIEFLAIIIHKLFEFYIILQLSVTVEQKGGVVWIGTLHLLLPSSQSISPFAAPSKSLRLITGVGQHMVTRHLVEFLQEISQVFDTLSIQILSNHVGRLNPLHNLPHTQAYADGARNAIHLQ